MILHEGTAPFGGLVTDIINDKFKCVVTTAKEGIFKGLSTMIIEVDDFIGTRPCAKIIYSNTLHKEDRKRFHRIISIGIDEAGENGATLFTSLQVVIGNLKDRGVVSEFINLS